MRLSIVLLILYTSVSCNAQEAYRTTLNGIIIHEYNMTSYGTFCEGITYFIYKNETLVLLSRIDYNQGILRKYPDLQKELGRPEIYKSDQFDMDFRFDLHFAEYNKHKFENGKTFVNSDAFFYQDSISTLYTAYQATAEFIKYQGIYNYIKSNLSIDIPMKDCFCPSNPIKGNGQIFLVLTKTLNINKLTSTQVNQLRLRLTGIKSIELFYCE